VAGGHSFGSIAQDWEPILPEAVKQGDIKTLAYGQAALVAAINIAKHDTEQDKEIRKLRERVADLEKEVKRLTA
jgi:cell division protein FtsB